MAAARKDQMKTSHKIIIILVVLILQFFWLATPRIGPHSYRHSERIAAVQAWLNHPSPATNAAFNREAKLLARHERRMQFLLAGVCWLVDVVAIYLFLTWGNAGALKNG
jgi:hypothetical protein